MMGLCETMYADDMNRLDELRERSGIDAHFASKECHRIEHPWYESVWIIGLLMILTMLC